jgi:hypothetical protein
MPGFQVRHPRLHGVAAVAVVVEEASEAGGDGLERSGVLVSFLLGGVG